MDLSIKFQNTLVSIRVAAIIRLNSEYVLFEKSPKGYFFLIGGKIKLVESSLEALKREIFEEIGEVVQSAKLKGVVENFYSNNEENIQEICFVCEVNSVPDKSFPENFSKLRIDEIDSCDIKPKEIIDLIKGTSEMKHIVIKK